MQGYKFWVKKTMIHKALEIKWVYRGNIIMYLFSFHILSCITCSSHCFTWGYIQSSWNHRESLRRLSIQTLNKNKISTLGCFMWPNSYCYVYLLKDIFQVKNPNQMFSSRAAEQRKLCFLWALPFFWSSSLALSYPCQLTWSNIHACWAFGYFLQGLKKSSIFFTLEEGHKHRFACGYLISLRP